MGGGAAAAAAAGAGAVRGTLRDPAPTVAKLKSVGVLGEMSDSSGLDTARLRFLRLDDDAFFRTKCDPAAKMPLTLLGEMAGEAGGALPFESGASSLERAGGTVAALLACLTFEGRGSGAGEGPFRIPACPRCV